MSLKVFGYYFEINDYKKKCKKENNTLNWLR